MITQQQLQEGREIRNRIIGERRAKALERLPDDDPGRPLTDLVDEYCFLNRKDEFQIHVAGALRNGCTADEIREVILQVAVYAGIPAGVSAFRWAKETLDKEGQAAPPKP